MALNSPKRGVELHFCGGLNQAFVFQTVRDQIGNGHELHVVKLGQLDQFGKPSHGSIFVHDFHDDPRGFASRQAREIDSRFGVARSTKDASGLGAQREDVSGLAQFVGLRLWINECLDGFGPIAGRNAGGASVPHQVDRDGERRFVGRVVGLHHQIQFQFVAA